MEILASFGVNGKLFLAQLVNFVVLLGILYFIGYKPILKFVNERTAKIEEGLKNAEEAAKKLEYASAEEHKLLAEARKEAVSIIEASRTSAKEQADQILAKAKGDVADVIVQGKKTIEAERLKMVAEVKNEVIDMVVLSTTKVLGKAIDKNVDSKWLKETLAKK